MKLRAVMCDFDGFVMRGSGENNNLELQTLLRSMIFILLSIIPRLRSKWKPCLSGHRKN